MRILLLGSFYLVGLALQAQNLVLNPFFIPTKNSKTEAQLHLVPGYSNPNQGTTDFYSRSASKYEVGIPQNFVGWQEINGTDHYAGIIAYYADQTKENFNAQKSHIGYGKYAEYLQVQLREPLKAGEKYRVSFESSLAETSGYSCLLGGYFSSSLVSEPSNEKLRFTPQISSGTLLEDKVLWTKTTSFYTAVGGELYFIIGRYSDEVNVVAAPNSNNNLRAYYYLANVEVISAKMIPLKDLPVERTEEVVTDSKHNFKWPVLTFETNKSELSSSAIKELRRVATWLKSQPKIGVIVAGHTDRVGDQSYNETLSKSRAEKTKAYLVRLGVEAKRIEVQALGSTSPAEDNGPASNAKNRRVTVLPK